MWRFLNAVWELCRAYAVFSVWFWLTVWIAGSCLAGQPLGPHDLIATANRWFNSGR